jgi:predicted transcriptional regulator
MLELGRTDVTTRNIVKELARIGALSASEPNKYRLVVFSITEKGKKILELHSELESLLK